MTAFLDLPSTSADGQRKVDRLLAHYGESHRDPRNEVIHFIAIPVIMISLVGMLYALHPAVAYAFIVASLVYYVRLSLVCFVAMVIGSVLMLTLIFAMGRQVLPVCAALFVGAWVMQFVGHRIEGRKPSFFEDIQYLWVGPLFVLSKLFVKLGIRW